MLKKCGSVADCSLVLFSIFGLFALHQESFLLSLLFNFLLLIIYFLWGEVNEKRAVYGQFDDGESRFFIRTVCVCSSHDSLLLSGGICLDVI